MLAHRRALYPAQALNAKDMAELPSLLSLKSRELEGIQADLRQLNDEAVLVLERVQRPPSVGRKR